MWVCSLANVCSHLLLLLLHFGAFQCKVDHTTHNCLISRSNASLHQHAHWVSSAFQPSTPYYWESWGQQWLRKSWADWATILYTGWCHLRLDKAIQLSCPALLQSPPHHHSYQPAHHPVHSIRLISVCSTHCVPSPSSFTSLFSQWSKWPSSKIIANVINNLKWPTWQLSKKPRFIWSAY